MAAKSVTRVRVRLSDAHTNQTIKSWVIVVRGAAGEHNALVRARVKARQHAAYEPGDHIEVEIAKSKARKVANPSSRSGLTDTDRKRLAAGGARGGDYGPNAVAVFGGSDGDPAAVVEYVRGKWTVSVIDEHGRHRGSKTYASRATAFREAQFDESNIGFENPSRKPIDHKFAGALFSAGQSKTALAYLRGTLTKSTARELAAGKKRR